jgi:hypothetical protein
MQLVARVDEVALCSSISPLKGMTLSSNPTEIMCGKEAMKARMSEIIGKLTPDQCEHFAYALEQVASCYLSPSSHGALLIANEKDESQSLVAINASEIEISEMVGFMAVVMRKNHSHTVRKYIN